MRVKGIRFKPCSLGSKQLCLAWREFSDFLRLNLTAGSPAKLQFVDWPELEKVRLTVLVWEKTLESLVSRSFITKALWSTGCNAENPDFLVLIFLKIVEYDSTRDIFLFYTGQHNTSKVRCILNETVELNNFS